jgi:hypothetical protein
MAEVSEIGDYGRIEDFIALAKEGKDVQVSIELKKQVVAQKVHPGDTEDMKREIDMYLLIGAYTFSVGRDVKQVSKVYVYGSLDEPPGIFLANINIANARLRSDYRRLRDANIKVEEKYF